MKLAVLDAVPGSFRHVDEYLTDGQKFIDLFADAGFEGQIDVFDAAEGDLPASPQAYSAYLVTGSPASVYEGSPWIDDLCAFVQAAYADQRRLVGVCFGHQLISQALGGEVVKAENGWMIGLHGFSISQTLPWMSPPVGAAALYHFNQDQVVRLPAGAQRIGTSASCLNSMYVIGDQVLCMQGHPEMPLRSMHNFLNHLDGHLPPDVVSGALASFEQGQPDRLLVGGWLRSFLEG